MNFKRSPGWRHPVETVAKVGQGTLRGWPSCNRRDGSSTTVAQLSSPLAATVETWPDSGSFAALFEPENGQKECDAAHKKSSDTHTMTTFADDDRSVFYLGQSASRQSASSVGHGQGRAVPGV